MSFERYAASNSRRIAVSNPALVPLLVQAIWDAHGLGAVKTITSPTLGQNNRIYFVNETYAIRFDTLYTLDNKRETNHRFGGEAWLFKALSAVHGIPVPHFVALDTSCTIAPCEYLITSRLPGDNLIARWQHMDENERRRLVGAAAEALATLHNTPVPFTRWGNVSDIVADKAGGFPSWRAYVENFYRYYAEEAARKEALSLATLATLKRRFSEVQPTLDAVQTPSFVHNDYHWENILYDGDQLTGIVDWEWSVVGDPSLDFKVKAEWERRCPGSGRLFLEAYTALRPFDKAHGQRLAFYRLITHLDDVTAYAGEDFVQHKSAVERLQRALYEPK